VSRNGRHAAARTLGLCAAGFSGMVMSLALLGLLDTWLPMTVSHLELAWTCTALAGMVRYAGRLGRAGHALWDIRQQGINGISRLLASSRVVRYLALTVVFEGFVGIGVLTMTLPTGPVTDPDTPSAWAIALLLLGIQAVLVVKGEQADRYERGALRLYTLQLPAEEAPSG
jgi:hypothetical protein